MAEFRRIATQQAAKFRLQGVLARTGQVYVNTLLISGRDYSGEQQSAFDRRRTRQMENREMFDKAMNAASVADANGFVGLSRAFQDIALAMLNSHYSTGQADVMRKGPSRTTPTGTAQ